MQQLHNGVIVDVGNASASLDPKQIPNDANDLLMKGAAALAAGKTLGLSEEEVLAAVSRQARSDMRQYAPAGLAGTGTSFIDAQNDVIRRTQQAQAALGQISPLKAIPGDSFTEGVANEFPGEPSANEKRKVRPTDEFSADSEQTYTSNDREYVSPIERESKARTRRDKERTRDKRRAGIEEQARKEGRRVFENPLVSLSDYGEDQGSADFENPKVGTSEYGTKDARVEPTAAYIREEQKARERASAQELMFDERLRLSGREPQRQLNDERAAVEAASLAGNYGSFPSRPIIVTRGGRMAVQYDGTDADVKGSYIDPRTGQSIEVRAPESDVIAGSNTPNTEQQLNAPSTRSATEFVAKMSSEGSINTRDIAYPQVDIGTQLGGLDEAITKASEGRRFTGLRSRVPEAVTSIDSFQKTMDAILSMASERGDTLGSTEGATRSAVNEPGIREALDAMGIKNEYAQEQIALALNARIQGRPVTFDPASDRMVPDSLPLKGFSYGGKSIKKFPKNRQIKADAGFTDPGTAESAIGVAKEGPTPQVTKVVGPVEDVAATKRLQYLKGPMGKGGNLVQQAADYLRRQGNPSPTFGEAMDLIESGMERRVSAGAKPLNEESLSRTVARTEGAAQRFDRDEENRAMARLLAGPLAPGRPERPDAPPERTYVDKPNVMTEGAQRALQEERSKNRGPGAIPNEPEMSELIRIARRMR